MDLVEHDHLVRQPRQPDEHVTRPERSLQRLVDRPAPEHGQKIPLTREPRLRLGILHAWFVHPDLRWSRHRLPSRRMHQAHGGHIAETSQHLVHDVEDLIAGRLRRHPDIESCEAEPAHHRRRSLQRSLRLPLPRRRFDQHRRRSLKTSSSPLHHELQRARRLLEQLLESGLGRRRPRPHGQLLDRCRRPCSRRVRIGIGVDLALSEGEIGRVRGHPVTDRREPGQPYRRRHRQLDVSPPQRPRIRQTSQPDQLLHHARPPFRPHVLTVGVDLPPSLRNDLARREMTMMPTTGSAPSPRLPRPPDPPATAVSIAPPPC
ncbi:hypothetical protein SAMN04489730_6411 [Amycolatopsis australiensis]|uniref:Uncharacterized protein n=1 Tax=Amycolatopsis australiensis TaxID=546364 RepID=A0A1K1SQG2_9PSEU|nr:hypothetical protein SAMN04489730_6411 [Amycolatopsis australiensis]